MSGLAADRLAVWRSETPGCEMRAHLNNAGAALMPRSVIDAVVAHLELEGNIGGYEASYARAEAIEATYDRLAELIGASRHNVAVVNSATMAFVQALSSMDLDSGDVIVTSRSDYTSHQIQYLSLARRRGCRIIHAPNLPGGGIDPDGVRQILTSETCRLVCVSWVPTHSGLVQDVAAVGEVCEGAGVPYFVDACQAAGQIPIDVETLRCDYLSGTGRKFLRGPRGIGWLYASDRALARGDHPLFVDMHGAQWKAPDVYEISPSARRYEEWEKAYALLLGLSAAVRYALDVGVGVAGERARALADRARAGLSSLPGVRVLDPGEHPCAIVTAEIGELDATLVARRLRDRGINTVSSERWYGLLDFTAQGVSSALRVSPHYYNTSQEIDAMIAGVSDVLEGVRAR